MKNDINRLGTAMIIRITEDFIGLTEERALSYNFWFFDSCTSGISLMAHCSDP
ncbi:MAG: hypothetical protein ACJ72J_09495 [Nitrososphaeraceae archaeon]|jgi:hypothetical protein